jgi:hypothetical protein
MAMKKILTNYQAKVNEIISRWLIEVEKYQALGTDYIEPIVARAIELDNYKLSEYQSTPEKLRKMVLESFEIQNQNIEWLKSFLSKNLSFSQVEPLYMTCQGHDWYTNFFNRYNSYREERALIEGQARAEPSFYYHCSKLPSKENFEDVWLYQDAIYGFNGLFSHDEQKLLILENADKERKKFEKLKNRFSGKESEEIKYERARIPEEVRIAVWRRDQGKCARCGNRENLEYDHIVPVSKGGGNTARNIELLCQDCNRSKGNRIE